MSACGLHYSTSYSFSLIASIPSELTKYRALVMADIALVLSRQQ